MYDFSPSSYLKELVFIMFITLCSCSRQVYNFIVTTFVNLYLLRFPYGRHCLFGDQLPCFFLQKCVYKENLQLLDMGICSLFNRGLGKYCITYSNWCVLIEIVVSVGSHINLFQFFVALSNSSGHFSGRAQVLNLLIAYTAKINCNFCLDSVHTQNVFIVSK